MDDQNSLFEISVICIMKKEGGASVLNKERNYSALRPKNVTHQKFLLSTDKTNLLEEYFFFFLKKAVLELLNLPNAEIYTDHYFRRSAATMLMW